MSLIATAPASSAAEATSAEKVSAETGTPSAGHPLTAGTSAGHLLGGGHRRARLGGDGADVEHVEAVLDQRPPSSIARSGVKLRAPSNIESEVTLTIPAASGARGRGSGRRVARSGKSLPLSSVTRLTRIRWLLPSAKVTSTRKTSLCPRFSGLTRLSTPGPKASVSSRRPVGKPAQSLPGLTRPPGAFAGTEIGLTRSRLRGSPRSDRGRTRVTFRHRVEQVVGSHPQPGRGACPRRAR